MVIKTVTNLVDSDNLLIRLQQYQETTNSIIEEKDNQIQALSEVLAKLTARLEEFEDAKPRPNGSLNLGVV